MTYLQKIWQTKSFFDNKKCIGTHDEQIFFRNTGQQCKFCHSKITSYMMCESMKFVAHGCRSCVVRLIPHNVLHLDNCVPKIV